MPNIWFYKLEIRNHRAIKAASRAYPCGDGLRIRSVAHPTRPLYGVKGYTKQDDTTAKRRNKPYTKPSD